MPRPTRTDTIGRSTKFLAWDTTNTEVDIPLTAPNWRRDRKLRVTKWVPWLLQHSSALRSTVRGSRSPRYKGCTLPSRSTLSIYRLVLYSNFNSAGKARYSIHSRSSICLISALISPPCAALSYFPIPGGSIARLYHACTRPLRACHPLLPLPHPPRLRLRSCKPPPPGSAIPPASFLANPSAAPAPSLSHP